MTKCEKCGKEIECVNVDYFCYDGSDVFESVPLEEHGNGTYIDLSTNWCGYEFDEDSEDILDYVRCPHCGKYPFIDTEIQKYEFERVVMFNGKERNIGNTIDVNTIITGDAKNDLVAVVRCKDCKHNVINHGRYCTFGDCLGCLVADDFFCKNGKRRETE